MNKLVVFFLFIIQYNYAQTEDAWVYFVDKENVSSSIQNPISILTQEAIDRKKLHQIAIDEKDVPVNENYISQLKNTNGIEVLAKSKWFNCVFVRGALESINVLKNLSFVDRIDYADNALDGLKTSSNKKRVPYRSGSKLKLQPVFNYGNTRAQIEQLNADELHRQNYTGLGMRIAVMDSGFPGVDVADGFKKVRDEGRLLDGYDFVRRTDNEFGFQGSSHGTQTLSDMAGFIANEFVGTAPDATYYLFITEDADTEGPKEEALWVEAAERADSLGVDIINTSLGYSINYDNPSYEYSPSDMDGQTAFISRGANIAYAKGMLLVTSAGNSGRSNWGIITAPGDAPGCLTVGAIDANGNYVSFSSIGPTADNRVKPDVMARGLDASVILPNSTIAASNGTSFSSPIMAGAVACLWQAFPSKSNEEIMDLVRKSASQYTNPSNQMGYGIPDFKAILANLSSDGDEIIKNSNIYPNPIRDRLYIEMPLGGFSNIKIFSIDGKAVHEEKLNNSNTIVLDHLSSGLYILEFQTESSRTILKLSKE